jgi:murein DD-endopeptidase MepM/ murein hydrolase activator NlpD
MLPILAKAISPDELRRQIQDKQDEIKKLEEQIAAYKTEIGKKKAQESTLSKQIAYMQTQIRRLEAEIKLTRTKISAAGLRIEGLTADINAQNIKIEKQKNNLSETIRTINEYDQETPIELVLKNNNFSDFLNQVQFIETLQQGIRAKLDEIKQLKTQLQDKKNDFQAQKNELEQLSDELSGKNLVLSNEKEETQDLLVQTKNQEKKYQQMLADLQKKREDIQREIYGLEDKLRLTIDPNSIPSFKAGVLAWPLQGSLTQKYGPTSETGFINEAYKFHNGIDIGADVGDPVRTAGDGIVKALGNNGKYAYGKWIAIDHQNGLITLYAHFSGYAVKAGQTVKAGQIIGYAGNTGFSTGPHLHFTVYAATTFSTEQKWYGLLPLGGSINPMNYL